MSLQTEYLMKLLHHSHILQAAERTVSELQDRVEVSGEDELDELREAAEGMGLAEALASYDVDRAQEQAMQNQWGRPSGFTGLVLYTPRSGVPVLVGHQGAESDSVMRQASKGKDLWFQVQ